MWINWKINCLNFEFPIFRIFGKNKNSFACQNMCQVDYLNRPDQKKSKIWFRIFTKTSQNANLAEPVFWRHRSWMSTTHFNKHFSAFNFNFFPKESIFDEHFLNAECKNEFPFFNHSSSIDRWNTLLDNEQAFCDSLLISKNISQLQLSSDFLSSAEIVFLWISERNFIIRIIWTKTLLHKSCSLFLKCTLSFFLLSFFGCWTRILNFFYDQFPEHIKETRLQIYTLSTSDNRYWERFFLVTLQKFFGVPHQIWGTSFFWIWQFENELC